MVKYSKISFLALSWVTFVYVGDIPKGLRRKEQITFQFKEIRLVETTGKNILFLGSSQ